MNGYYGHAANYIIGQVKRFDTYNFEYDKKLYDLITRDPDYVIKTLVYTAQGYFGVQSKYECIVFMMNGPKFFPANIYVPVRREISDNWMYIVNDEFYEVWCNNSRSIIHPGVDDVDKMLMGMNYDVSINLYDGKQISYDTLMFIIGFIRSINYDLLQLYTCRFLVDEDILRDYLLQDLAYEAEPFKSGEIFSEPLQYIEFSTILFNSISSNDENIVKAIENAVQFHIGAIYEKYGLISFYNDPFRKVIESKVFNSVVELIYSLFEDLMEYLIVNPYAQIIPEKYIEEHKLNVGKAIRILTLPMTETGVYHVM